MGPLDDLHPGGVSLFCGERDDCTLREFVEERLMLQREATKRLELGVQRIPNSFLSMKVKDLRAMGFVWETWNVC